MFSRKEAIVLFGELDVWRAEHKKREFYVSEIATSKTNYLAFSAASSTFQVLWNTDEAPVLREWLHSLPELIRGALIWWMLTPGFSLAILNTQSACGYWPFHRKVN